MSVLEQLTETYVNESLTSIHTMASDNYGIKSSGMSKQDVIERMIEIELRNMYK